MTISAEAVHSQSCNPLACARPSHHHLLPDPQTVIVRAKSSCVHGNVIVSDGDWRPGGLTIVSTRDREKGATILTGRDERGSVGAGAFAAQDDARGANRKRAGD